MLEAQKMPPVKESEEKIGKEMQMSCARLPFI